MDETSTSNNYYYDRPLPPTPPRRRKSLDGVQCCAVILAVLFPPLGVLLVDGCSCDLLINFFLTILYVPGLVHALYIIFYKYKD